MTTPTPVGDPRLPNPYAASELDAQQQFTPGGFWARTWTRLYELFREILRKQSNFTNAAYVLIAKDSNLPNARALTAGANITVTDAGAGTTVTIAGLAGTVTSVSGTSPINVATGTTTPVISLASPLVLPANGLTVGTPQFTTSGGFVGVGTASPAAPLDTLGVGRFLSWTPGSYPASGKGIELFYHSPLDASFVQSYDRTGSLWKELSLRALTTTFYVSGTLTATLNTAGFNAPAVQENTETLAPANNAAQALNWNFGGSLVTTNGTNAITFSNVQAAPALATHTVYVSAFNNVTWPAAVTWGLGGIPSIAGAAWVSLVSRNGGTNVEASAFWRAN